MQCDECDIWYHTSCMGVTSLNYEVLANSNISWTCCNCGIPNFSTSLFSQWTIEFTNSFSTLSNLSESDDLPISPPVATSSPKSSQHKNQNADGQKQTKNTRKPQRSLKVLVVNFQSIKNKVPELTACLENHKPDVVIGTETWLYPSVQNSELFPEDYTVIRKDRNDKHGGVLIALKNDLVCAHLTDLDANCEMVWAQVQLVGSKALYIGAFYRPQTQKDLKYMNELRQSLTIIKNSHKGNIWLGGDFNLGGINWQDQSINQGTCISPKNLSEQLIDIANDFDLDQMVTEPTRKNNILDLFFTNNATLVEKSTLVPGLSDHEGIAMITININPKRCRQKPHKVYLYNKADMESIRSEISDFGEDFIKDTHKDIDPLWTEFKTKLLDTMDKHIPSKMVNKSNKAPWINSKVKRLHRRKQRAYNTARKTGEEKDWDTFRQQRKDTHKATRFCYRRYVREFCLESRKQFWSFVKNLKKDSTGIPALKDHGILVSDNTKKAELLNNQFKNVFTLEDMDSMPDPLPMKYKPICDITIYPEGIQKLLSNLNPHKATGPDGISPRILKELAPELAPILSFIYQTSLNTGKLPQDWKTANISPIFKKGDRVKASNYRPVSLTSVACKLLKHVIHSHIMKYFDAHNVLTPQQHGFRQAHSCETQLIQTVHDFTTSLNNNTQTDVVIMDFSKAFDVVPHNRLLLKLSQYGIDGSINRWIGSFLKGRKQRVVIGGDHSNWATVDSGVPQGTVLGPLLFLVYINDLPQNINSTVRLFADDCVIYKEIKSSQDADILQKDLETLSAWEKLWQMKFNSDKCYVLRIPASRSPLITNYKLGDSILQETKTHTYLGVDIQHDLKWNTHINRITASASRTLGFVRRNLSSCNKETKKAAYIALVRPTVEYCSAVWDPYTKELTQKVEKIQRRAARMVYNNYDWKTSVNELIQELQWDSLSNRRKNNRLAILHKAIGGHLAIPVQNYLQPAQRRTRRSSHQNFIEYHSRIDSHKYSYIPRTIKDWNDLPESTANIQDSTLFKTALSINQQGKQQD